MSRSSSTILYSYSRHLFPRTATLRHSVDRQPSTSPVAEAQRSGSTLYTSRGALWESGNRCAFNSVLDQRLSTDVVSSHIDTSDIFFAMYVEQQISGCPVGAKQAPFLRDVRLSHCGRVAGVAWKMNTPSKIAKRWRDDVKGHDCSTPRQSACNITF